MNFTTNLDVFHASLDEIGVPAGPPFEVTGMTDYRLAWRVGWMMERRNQHEPCPYTDSGLMASAWFMGQAACRVWLLEGDG